MEVNLERKEALLHFERWSKRFDEWIPFGSARVRPMPEEVPLGRERASRRSQTAGVSGVSTVCAHAWLGYL